MTYAALAFDTAGWHGDELVLYLSRVGDSFSTGGGLYSRLYTNVLNRFYWFESAMKILDVNSWPTRISAIKIDRVTEHDLLRVAKKAATCPVW